MLTTTQVGNLAGCSRFTVERACRNKELTAAKLGRNWMIEDAEGKRWAEQYRPHARTGKKISTGNPAAATSNEQPEGRPPAPR